MGEVACYFFEGASMGVLMYFHRTNFKQGSLFATEELAYISIKPNEFHRFDTESVDDHSLGDRSSGDELDDSSQAGCEEASLDCDAIEQLITSRYILNHSSNTTESKSSSLDQN